MERQLLGIMGVYPENGVFAEDGFHDKRFALAHLIGHFAQQHFVPHGHRGIAGKEEVMQRTERITLLAQELGEVVAAQHHPFNQLFGQLLGLKGEQKGGVVESLFLLTDGTYQKLFTPWVFQYASQQFGYFESLGYFFQHPFQLGVLFRGHREVKDIAVEGTLCIFRGHIFHFVAGGMQDNPFETTNFGRYIDRKFFHKGCFVLLKSIRWAKISNLGDRPCRASPV